jgi:hypothetical protein
MKSPLLFWIVGFTPLAMGVVALNYATQEIYFNCAGSLTNEFPPRKYDLHVTLSRNRWFNRQEGDVRLDIPHLHSEHVGKAQWMAAEIRLYDAFGGQIKGSLFLRDGRFTVTTMSKQFAGSCEEKVHGFR